MSISESTASALVGDNIKVQRARLKERKDFSGRTLGEFLLCERIGEGGFGAVYRCEQPLLGCEAVVKVLHQRLERNNVALQRFMREVSLASRLDHRYAARVHAFGIEYNDGLFWIAMEMVHGTALNRWLREHGAVPLDKFVPFFECVAEVVQAAHDRGIVHRDLKPSNIMVTQSRRRLVPKLLDFGLAKLFDEPRLQPRHDSKRTFGNRRVVSSDSRDSRGDSISNSVGEISDSNTVIGTPAYMSPEQWNHPDSVGPASDLYALGIVAYEAITGRRPFIAATLSEYAELHSEATIPPLDKGLPPALDDWFERALAKRPERRWNSALELAATLRAAANLKGESGTAPELQALPPSRRETEPTTATTGAEVTAGAEMQAVPRRFTVSSSAAVRITVYSATGSKLGVGDGDITLSLIPGLYRVHLRRCGLTRELLVEHVRDTELRDLGPSLDSPAPLSDGPISSPYGEAARQLSLSNTHRPLGKGSHSSRLFLFIRRKSSKAGPGHVPSEPITIHDRTGRKLISLDREAVLCDDELGYAALSCRVVPGTYRIRALHSHREVAVTIPENRAAHVFLADTGAVRIEDLRISLVVLGCAFDPESRVGQAMESVLAALRSPELTFPADARSLLPDAAQQDLCFGIAVAQQLWRCEEIVTFDRVMKHLRPHSQIPDVAILAHLRPHHLRAVAARLLPWRYRAFQPSFAVPPLLRASQTMVMTRREFDVSNVAADSVFARAIATEFHDSVWFTWSARAWDERWIEPTVESLRDLGHRSAAAIAPMIGLPPQTVERAIMRLDSRPTFDHGPFTHLKEVRIPGYALEEVVGRDTHGMVFKATHTSDGRPVAIKLIPLARGGGERIEKALELLQRLHHPGLVTYHRWGTIASDTVLWIDLEPCYRSALDILLSSNAPFAPDRALQIAMEALDALGSLHSEGIVHGNIKPSELLIRENGSVALADASAMIGFASYEPLVSLTTPSFVAPEQLVPAARATAVSDVWSMAATLYFLLTLDAPRDEYSSEKEVETVRENAAISIMERYALVPRELARCIDYALSTNVHARPKDGNELRESLISAHRLDIASAQSREPSRPDVRPRRGRPDASPAQYDKRRWHTDRVPALTIVSHPVGHRVGERLLLDAVIAGKEVMISRGGPRFTRGREVGLPLGDPFVSRKPIRFVPAPDGGIEILVEPGGTQVIAGSPIESAVAIPLDEISQGVPLVLAKRVVLLLHWVWVDHTAEDGVDALGMVGTSAGIRRVRSAIEKIADLTVPVLIRGEAGTGKKLVARAIHDRRSRRGSPFVSVNLRAIPRELAAAELFGAAPGAYTGASPAREGLFRTAHGGTLFLDEVGEASTEIQVALLRALETGEIYPVGAEKPVAIQVRLITATDDDLETRIREGRFKAPLLHRLAGQEIRLPPLRKRREDIGPLFYHFAREELEAIGEADRLSPQDPHARPWLPAAVAAQLVRHTWPGNIRQLQNVTRQLVIGSRGLPQLRLDPGVADELAIGGAQPGIELIAPRAPTDPGADEVVAGRAGSDPVIKTRRQPSEVSEAELLEALQACRWDLKAAADRLRIPRASIFDLIKRSPNIRTAGDLSAEEIAQCFHDCNGDLDAMVGRLQVSRRALSRRLRELGLAGKRK